MSCRFKCVTSWRSAHSTSSSVATPTSRFGNTTAGRIRPTLKGTAVRSLTSSRPRRPLISSNSACTPGGAGRAVRKMRWMRKLASSQRASKAALAMA